MNTSGLRIRQDSSRPGTRANILDVVLLIVAVLMLAGAAAAIVISFPQALEIVAMQANAAVAPAADAQSAGRRQQAADEREDENEPFFADDIRPDGTMYAGAASAGAAAGSALEASVVSR